MFKIDLLRRSPALFKLGQRSLWQQIKNSAACVVDRNNHHIAALRHRQAANVMLGGQVAEQSQHLAVFHGNAHGR